MQAPETAAEEYAIIIKHILEERGYTVGDENEFKTDVNLNVASNFIVFGSIQYDKSWYNIKWNGQKLILDGTKEFNLGDPDSFQKIGDYLEKSMGQLLALPYHFFP